jgi:hypothetical protein
MVTSAAILSPRLGHLTSFNWRPSQVTEPKNPPAGDTTPEKSTETEAPNPAELTDDELESVAGGGSVNLESPVNHTF